MDETMLPMKTTAQMVRSGIASAVGGADVAGYYSCVLPGEQRGQISLTVTTDQGREHTLTYLMGQYTNKEVASLSNGPDHDIQVVYDLISTSYIANHVRTWLAGA